MNCTRWLLSLLLLVALGIVIISIILARRTAWVRYEQAQYFTQALS